MTSFGTKSTSDIKQNEVTYTKSSSLGLLCFWHLCIYSEIVTTVANVFELVLVRAHSNLDFTVSYFKVIMSLLSLNRPIQTY